MKLKLAIVLVLAAASLQAQVTFDRILNGGRSRTTGCPTRARRRTSATAR